uniref:BAG domain-containing protein n=1 Tax=Fagus sylvatica TaxID=28930 RepID=A0A2N9GCF2_FAGSY
METLHFISNGEDPYPEKRPAVIARQSVAPNSSKTLKLPKSLCLAHHPNGLSPSPPPPPPPKLLSSHHNNHQPLLLQLLFLLQLTPCFPTITRPTSDFSKPLLFTFFNQTHKTITNIIIIIIITILTLNLSNSILKTNTNITNDLKTHASKKSQLPIPSSPLCFAASMLLSPRSTIFPFLLLHLHSYCPPHSLRDLAARVIQTHFRAFLVRRSRTLGHLKDLALIKSAFNSLKSSFSSETHFDFDVLSHKAMDLPLKLDSVQGRDPMIRDGKRSISRDLVRFLEFIDGVAVKRRGLSFKATKNMSFGHPNELLKIDEDDVELEGFQQAIDDEEEEEEEEENHRVVISGKNGQIRNGVLVKRNGVQSKVKKSVSFAENGNVDDEGELEGNLCSELEEVKVFPQGTEEEEEEEEEEEDEAHLENEGSPQTSDGERYNARFLRNGGDYEIRGHCHDQNVDFLYSAPLPVKMESKADQMKKRRAVKIGT